MVKVTYIIFSQRYERSRKGNKAEMDFSFRIHKKEKIIALSPQCWITLIPWNLCIEGGHMYILGRWRKVTVLNFLRGSAHGYKIRSFV